MKHWLNAFRLRTLPLSFSNILLGSALAYLRIEENRGRLAYDEFSWLIMGLTLTTTLLLQILSNLANDYGDALKGADNEGRIGPMRSIQSGAISASAMLRAIVITSVLAFIAGISLLLVAFGDHLNWTFAGFIVLGLAAIAAAIKYTVGKRAYGYAGMGDFFVFLFFGIVGVVGTYYLQTLTIDFNAIFLPAITMGCFSVAVLNLNNMRDRENDALVGKRTMAVKLGFKKSKVYHYAIFIVGYLVFPIPMLLLGTEYPELFIFTLPILVLHFLHIRTVARITNPKDFDPELKKVALSAFLFSILFFVTVYFFH